MHRACTRDATAGWRKEFQGRQRSQALRVPSRIPLGWYGNDDQQHLEYLTGG